MNNLEELANSEETLLEVNNDYFTGLYGNLKSLENKEFFKTLIKEGYFKDYVFDLVMSLLNNRDEQLSRNIVLEKLVGIAKLQEYFSMIEALSTSEEGYNEVLTEKEVEYRNKAVKLNNALQEAEKDEDFKKLIMDGYLTTHALNNTSLITNDRIIREGNRTDVLETLAGISALRNYMVNVHKEALQIAYQESDEEESEE